MGSKVSGCLVKDGSRKDGEEVSEALGGHTSLGDCLTLSKSEGEVFADAQVCGSTSGEQCHIDRDRGQAGL